MANLRAYIANCLIGGQIITRYGTRRLRDTIEFECGGQTFTLTQKEEVITGDLSWLKGKFCKTTEILVKDVAEEKVTVTLAAIDRICWLLSFASLSRVVCYGHDYPDGSDFGATHNVSGSAQFFRPTFDIRDGSTIKSFIEQTYPNYIKVEKSRKLNVVIDYLLQAEIHNQPTECKLILAFVLLENLKHSFARKRKIPYKKGFFRKDQRPNGATYKFEELLQLMLLDLGMRRGLKRIVKLRNEIIHSGLSNNSHNQNWSMYEKIHDLLREYILRLLKYQGRYRTYSSASNSEAEIKP